MDFVLVDLRLGPARKRDCLHAPVIGGNKRPFRGDHGDQKFSLCVLAPQQQGSGEADGQAHITELIFDIATIGFRLARVVQGSKINATFRLDPGAALINGAVAIFLRRREPW